MEAKLKRFQKIDVPFCECKYRTDFLKSQTFY
jgi:hypothetical protein